VPLGLLCSELYSAGTEIESSGFQGMEKVALKEEKGQPKVGIGQPNPRRESLSLLKKGIAIQAHLKQRPIENFRDKPLG
jgi:hypothetical protein